jgi:hypothetical protein
VASDRDVVTAVFGAASGLAGLLLVFLGIVVAAYQSFAPGVPAAATARYRRTGWGILGAFLLGLAAAAVGFVWLLTPSRGLRDALVLLFSLQLGALAASALGVMRLVLWR